MTETLHQFIEHYGLLAVFLGCLAEGETVAMLGGFFAHQHVFAVWQTLLAVFAGAFAGDAAFFALGRRFAQTQLVQRISRRPGFDRARQLVTDHPNIYVLSNRYIYGMRILGGVVAGLSGIATARFLVLNAISAAVWATLFCGFGYLFGLGAEQIVGRALLHHERLLVAFAIGAIVMTAAIVIARHLLRREKARENRATEPSQIGAP
ncbi:MAG TPA: DedA family protein [Mesorhizobium sp.]|jgi:membrane protein DedA with SNARE-associated domain|uniref:DedA family protein n=1 Tax=Mesorhizobium sp. TaxID=1871066 RepID=UPI002DDD8E60|nr:DedA family protein [Mesorhizobium sp.]HEV2503835.1 DedA family protein [Mesorhizobium sp.]